MKPFSIWSGRLPAVSFGVATLFLTLAQPDVLRAASASSERQLLTFDLEDSRDQSRLRVVSSLPLEWQMSFADDGSPVLEFPDSTVGPQFRGQEYKQGPVAAVEVDRDRRGSVETTLLTIRTRRKIEISVSQAGSVLTVDLVPEVFVPSAAESVREVVPAIADDGQGMGDALPSQDEGHRPLDGRIEQNDTTEALERRLGEALAELEQAKRELATSRSEHARQLRDLEAERARLAGELEASREMLQARAPVLTVSSRAAPCLNVRAGAGPAQQVLACISTGTRVTLLRTESGWGRVRLPDGLSGWVAQDFLEPAASNPAQSQ